MLTRDERLRGWLRELKAQAKTGGPDAAGLRSLEAKWEIGDSERAHLDTMAANQYQRGLDFAQKKLWEEAAAEWETWPILAAGDLQRLEAAVQKWSSLYRQPEAAAALAEAAANLSAVYLKAAGGSGRAKSLIKKSFPAPAAAGKTGKPAGSDKTAPENTGAAAKKPFPLANLPWKTIGLWTAIALAGTALVFWLFSQFFGPAVGLSGLTATTPPKGLERAVPLQVEPGSLKFQGRGLESKTAAYPEAQLYLLSGYLVFPEVTVKALEGRLTLLDGQKNALTTSTFTLISPEKNKLDPGVALPLTQRLDITGQDDQVAAALLELLNPVTSGGQPTQSEPVELRSQAPLEKGFKPELVLTTRQWQTVFAGRLQVFSGSLVNQGLKPIRELNLEIQWQTAQGQILKISPVRVVSPNGPPLSPGSSVPFQAAGDFPQEIYRLQDGALPTAVFTITELN